MRKQYRFHFGFSKSKKYLQLLKLASLARNHEIIGSGSDIRHILTFDDEQIDLMAQAVSLHIGSGSISLNGIHVNKLMGYARAMQKGNKAILASPSADLCRIRATCEQLLKDLHLTPLQFITYLEDKYLKVIHSDHMQVWDALKENGYMPTRTLQMLTSEPPKHKPEEHILLYREIRNLISLGQYAEGVTKYYESLGSEPFGELNDELLYLKRLANIPISGRDLLAFKNKASWSALIKDNLLQYCSCIDSVLEIFQGAGRSSALEILIGSVPTLEQLVRRTQEWNRKGVYLWDGELRRDTTNITAEFFGKFICPHGRLFDRYPNPLIYHRDEGETSDGVFLSALWTTHKPSYIEAEIKQKGLHLAGIEAYRHRQWRLWGSKKREPDFKSLQSLQDIARSNYSISGIRYTGRTHQIGDKEFYEIDLLRKAPWSTEKSLPSLEEFADDALREAENLLREKHGLPRIGEGWVSEMLLFNLVKNIFADTEHHVSLPWLKPQELDVWVPSRNLAFEYQGIQHYEPVEFFGGKAALEHRQNLDKTKRNKCRTHGTLLIEWRYDEPIDSTLLLQKLKMVDIELGF
jgi:hypothetical protein